MPSTIKYAINYPSGTVAPNVPLVMQQQAESVEAALNNLPVAKGIIARNNAASTTNSFSTVGTWIMFDHVTVDLVANRWYEAKYTFSESTAATGVANQPFAVVARQSVSTDTTATGTDVDGSVTLWTAPIAQSGNGQEVSFIWKASLSGTFNIKMCFTKVVSNNQINVTNRRLSVMDLGAQF